jgi:hypothetical protein
MHGSFVRLPDSVATSDLVDYVGLSDEFFVDGIQVERELGVIIYYCEVIYTYILYMIVREAGSTH